MPADPAKAAQAAMAEVPVCESALGHRCGQVYGSVCAQGRCCTGSGWCHDAAPGRHCTVELQMYSDDHGGVCKAEGSALAATHLKQVLRHGDRADLKRWSNALHEVADLFNKASEVSPEELEDEPGDSALP